MRKSGSCEKYVNLGLFVAERDLNDRSFRRNIGDSDERAGRSGPSIARTLAQEVGVKFTVGLDDSRSVRTNR